MPILMVLPIRQRIGTIRPLRIPGNAEAVAQHLGIGAIPGAAGPHEAIAARCHRISGIVARCPRYIRHHQSALQIVVVHTEAQLIRRIELPGKPQADLLITVAAVPQIRIFQRFIGVDRKTQRPAIAAAVVQQILPPAIAACRKLQLAAARRAPLRHDIDDAAQRPAPGRQFRALSDFNALHRIERQRRPIHIAAAHDPRAGHRHAIHQHRIMPRIMAPELYRKILIATGIWPLLHLDTRRLAQELRHGPGRPRRRPGHINDCIRPHRLGHYIHIRQRIRIQRLIGRCRRNWDMQQQRAKSQHRCQTPLHHHLPPPIARYLRKYRSKRGIKSSWIPIPAAPFVKTRPR